jgi:hypothetical protein
MLKQFLIISLQYLARNRSVTVINIIGLTFGVTFSILSGLYIKKELSIDRAFIKGDSINYLS